jgi:Tfp pilus assembly protein PilZ
MFSSSQGIGIPFGGKNGGFLIRNILFLVRNAVFLIKNGVFLIRNAVFLIKNEVFLIRNAVFLIKNGVFLIRNILFLIRNAVFLIKNEVFLIRNVVFLGGNGRPWSDMALSSKTMSGKMWRSFGVGMFPSVAGARSETIANGRPSPLLRARRKQSCYAKWG